MFFVTCVLYLNRTDLLKRTVNVSFYRNVEYIFSRLRYIISAIKSWHIGFQPKLVTNTSGNRKSKLPSIQSYRPSRLFQHLGQNECQKWHLMWTHLTIYSGREKLLIWSRRKNNHYFLWGSFIKLDTKHPAAILS